MTPDAIAKASPIPISLPYTNHLACFSFLNTDLLVQLLAFPHINRPDISPSSTGSSCYHTSQSCYRPTVSLFCAVHSNQPNLNVAAPHSRQIHPSSLIDLGSCSSENFVLFDRQNWPFAFEISRYLFLCSPFLVY